MSDLKLKILSASKKIEEMYVPELETKVYLRRMNGNERTIFQEAHVKAEDDKVNGRVAILTLQPLLVSLTLCDQSGRLIFKDPDEVQEIDSIVIDRLANKAMEINGLTVSSREAIEKKVLEQTGSGST